jgi:hypothetical protein
MPDMNKQPKTHFWIPETEVHRFDKKLQARPKSKDVSFKEHGSKLSHSLQTIKAAIEQSEPQNSLRDKDIIVFNVELPEKEKIKDNQLLFDSNSMTIRAVRNERNAVVTTSKSQFQNLRKRIASYALNGMYKTYFDNIDSFAPYIGAVKDANSLQRIIFQDLPPATVDVQLMLIPDLGDDYYESALNFLAKKITENNGTIPEPVYYLSDHTPVIRAVIPSSTLELYDNDQAVYRIEPTSFFNVDAVSKPVTSMDSVMLKPEIDIASLPVVAVLDSGVVFPHNLESIVIQHWIAPGSRGGNAEHGTEAAGNAAFRYISQNLQDNIISPRARIIDCNILDGNVSTQNFIKRIQTAVATFSVVAKIYNLSANSNVPIEGDMMSIAGYELDILQAQRGVQFVVSAGNHDLWKTQASLEDIIGDDDSRVSPPADSLYSIAVGSIVGEDHDHSLSRKNEVAPYSRIGPGFKGLMKPDISAYTGTIDDTGTAPEDQFSLALTKNGMLAPGAGTSLAAPIIAGDLAEITTIVPDGNPLLAKTLLFHSAMPVWDMEDIDDDGLSFAHSLYGRGLSNLDESKYSSSSKVTFVRTGTLNRTTKEHVTIYMPEILAAQVGRNVARVSLTCVSAPPVDMNKGTEYLGAYIRASLKKSAGDGINLLPVAPDFKESRDKWDICQYISKPFTTFNAGDWQIWLELFGRWDKKALDVPYALAVTIEDISRSFDIYQKIEILNRYQPLNEVRVRLET